MYSSANCAVRDSSSAKMMTFQRSLIFHHGSNWTHLLPHLRDLLGNLLAGVLNFLLSCEKHQNVARRFTDVYLHHCPDGRLQVIPLWFLHKDT